MEELLQSKELTTAVNLIPRPIATIIIQGVITAAKKELRASDKDLNYKTFIKQIVNEIQHQKRKEITKVINATGIVVHTNLGRAPLSEKLFDEIKASVTGYGNVEFDISTGKRGKRGEALEYYLSVLSQAEAATIVNNCAAALFLIVNSLANRKKVIISRSELVQIGGGFRIPDILKKTGAKLVEIGTTNITTLSDYENAINDKTGLILKVHQSNFSQQGFVEQVSLKELSVLSKKYNIPLVNDLGSGVFIPTKKIINISEQTVQQSVKANASLTCFSGDKMLGGAQAGIIVGKTEYINKIKKNPLFRTYRVDKIVFSIMEKLVTLYLNNSYQDEIKLWSIISTSETELYKRGKKLLKQLANPDGVSIEATKAYIGGGAMPESDIPSVGLIFTREYKAESLLKKLREFPTPIIGRIENDRLVLDLKTIDESDYEYLIKCLRKII